VEDNVSVVQLQAVVTVGDSDHECINVSIHKTNIKLLFGFCLATFCNIRLLGITWHDFLFVITHTRSGIAIIVSHDTPLPLKIFVLPKVSRFPVNFQLLVLAPNNTRSCWRGLTSGARVNNAKVSATRFAFSIQTARDRDTRPSLETDKASVTLKDWQSKSSIRENTPKKTRL